MKKMILTGAFLVFLGISTGTSATSYLCGDHAIRLNLADQTVSITGFSKPQPVETRTLPMRKIKNGFEWTDEPPIKARLNLINMEIRYGFIKDGWVDIRKKRKCARPSILKK